MHLLPAMRGAFGNQSQATESIRERHGRHIQQSRLPAATRISRDAGAGPHTVQCGTSVGPRSYDIGMCA